MEWSNGTGGKNSQSRPPINPFCEGANTSVNPRTNHSIERIASPEQVCMITDSEFLPLMSPASKNPNAGVISMTRPVEISIHVVSPVSIGISVFYLHEP